MKSPIVFRASFRQPKGVVNPTGIKLTAIVEVEIYQSRVGNSRAGSALAEWRARRPGTTNDFKITPQSDYRTLQTQISGMCFEEQLSAWQACDSSDGFKVLRSDCWYLDSTGRPCLTESYKEEKHEALPKGNTVTK